MIRSIEQRRAQFALKKIQATANGNPGKYVSYVSAMPAQIYMNGLGQTLATMLAAADRQNHPQDDPHYLICQHLSEWLQKDSTLGNDCGFKSPIQLIEKLMEATPSTYLLAQVESLAFLDWLKKFARAILPEGE